jgi:hypothetical protein
MAELQSRIIFLEGKSDNGGAQGGHSREGRSPEFPHFLLTKPA